MALDMDRYRDLFLEEAAEHLAEMSGALLALEKDNGSVECIDVIFRMAHSIKSMAATLSYDSMAELSHALEDYMEGIRAAARVEGPETMALLFSGLEGLEQMLDVVRDSGESPAPQVELVAALSNSRARPEGHKHEPVALATVPIEARAASERGLEKKV